MGERPYLSVVVATRNDNHGGNLLQRMQVFVTGLLEQARRFDLPGELIVIEWNPPAGQSALSQALSWRSASEHFIVRIVQVPREIHCRYAYAAQLPLFQMIAKNVGIRRARGAFVLATSVDLLFSDALMECLASRSLERRRLYRTNRYDVPAEIPWQAPIEEQFRYCGSHVIRVFLRNGTFALDNFRPPGSLLLWLGSSPKIPAGLSHFFWRQSDNGAPTRTDSGHSPQPAKLQRWSAQLASAVGKILTRPSRPKLHVNACGDFTLMAREDWFELGGYPELELFSLHLDTLLCMMAYYGGIREHVFNDPMCIYHLEHRSSWTNDYQTNLELMQQLDLRQVPVLAPQVLNAYLQQMAQQQSPIRFNAPNWGLADENLIETIID